MCTCSMMIVAPMTTMVYGRVSGLSHTMHHVCNLCFMYVIHVVMLVCMSFVHVHMYACMHAYMFTHADHALAHECKNDR